MPPNLPIPDARKLDEHYLLGEILDHIHLWAGEFPNVEIDLLKEQINNIRNHNIDVETHLRQFLGAVERTAQVEVFIAGESEERVLAVAADSRGGYHLPPSRHVKTHFIDMAKSRLHLNGRHHNVTPLTNVVPLVNGLTHDKTNGYIPLPEIHENAAGTKIMEVHASPPFQNWGLSVSNTPKYTFVPKTVLGLQNLVKYAQKNNFRVRCSGYRHSWSNCFSADGEILINLLNLQEAEKVPNALSLEAEYIDPENEPKVIQFASPDIEAAVETEKGKALVRVGVAVSNEYLRRWAVQNDKWTLPMDIILVEVTVGGVNGPICHGAGRQHKTLSDQVRAIEYVDCNGGHRCIPNRAHLRAAAGCFGLLGIVTHVTLAMDPMSYAIMKPSKPDIGLAVPPLHPSDVPSALRKTWRPDQFAAANADFVERATNAYHSEWFWFTYQKTAWVNKWDTDTKVSSSSDPAVKGLKVVDYPNDFQTWCQWAQGWLGGIIMESKFFISYPAAGRHRSSGPWA